MKRILHIIPSLNGGGAERQLANVIGNTSKNEFSHFVCAFSDSGFFAPVINAAGYEVCELGIDGKYPWFTGAAKIRSKINDYRPDIITTWLYDANIAGRLARLWGAKIPIVTTLHSTDYEPETIRAAKWSPLKIEGLRQIDRLTARLTDPYFAACSHNVRKSFQKRLNIDDSQIRVIYNAADPESLKSVEGEASRIRRNLEIPPDAFVYLTVGRLDAMKNQALLVRNFSKVLAVAPQAHLVIVGTGVMEKELKEMAKISGVGNRIHFLGSRKDIGACLEMADVFVFPTLLEGFGIALVEAMFKGLPCIASNISVLQEILTNNETGLLFDPENETELVTAMIDLFRDPQMRMRLGNQALKDANQRFHIQKAASEWESFYRFITNGK
jgi:glycosyltransferase involved in cell wall biosynthesis